MISDVNKVPHDDPLAHEANLVAMLGIDNERSETLVVDSEIAIESLLDDAEVSQLLMRRSDTVGDVLIGYFRLPVLAGQQRISWHVPVSPPFAGLPKSSAETMDGTDARIRFTKVERFGARVELILPTAAQHAETLLVVVKLSCKLPQKS